MKRLVVFAALLFCTPAPQADARITQFLHTLRPRCIGPANMSGRITEVAVYDREPRIMYVASASGGVWKTVNNGTTWRAAFEHQTTSAVGAATVCQTDPDVVWVGTGEANAHNSVSWGDGVYRSIDGGKSWKHRGLKDTHHIGRIVIHPKKTATVYVAALGQLWAANKERGVFKTTDGGNTWQHVLALNDNTGCIDLAMDPDDPELLYAAAYQVRRDAFSGGNPAVQTGPHAGLYKTTDGGKTWHKMTRGLPDRPFGRCGFSIYRKDPNVVVAVVQTDKTSVTVPGQAANGKLDLDAGGIFRSDDKGQTWRHLNSLVPRPFYYGQIRVDPNDSERLYVLGINFHVSVNGGKSFKDGNAAKGTHVDYHALWINPRDSHHLVLGCDGGINFSYDRSATWEYLKNLPVSQFYAIGVDMKKPYRVYGGLQDSGTWGGPSSTRDPAGISVARWTNYLGYDGYYCQIHPKDNNILYAEGQYGMLHRINVRTGAADYIRPRLPSKEEKTNLVPPLPTGTADLRFNWNSPILQSPYAVDELFYGGNYLFVSKNRGDTWQAASPDLTFGKPGPNDYRGHTLTTIAASTLEDHLLYVGSDDGAICVCKEWKKRLWTDISLTLPNVPKERWITRLECSQFDKATVYLSFDRHRNDDRKPYVYRSTDYGLNWTSIVGNLPAEGPVHVIREDPVNKDLLYVGTEFGLYLSLDAGKTWHKQAHLPTVPVHDLVVHPRDHELVIGTHGRAIWIMDVLPLQELTAQRRDSNFYLCPVRPAAAYRQVLKDNLGIKNFVGENAPYGASIYYYLRDPLTEEANLTIVNAQGKKIDAFRVGTSAGVHRLVWNLNYAGAGTSFYPVVPGNYTAVLQVGNRALRETFSVEVDD